MENPRKIHPTNRGSIDSLPEDIRTSILLKLPVRPLLRFRCVSKSWLKLISSSQFINAYLSRYKLLLGNYCPPFDLKQYSGPTLLNDHLSDGVDALILDYYCKKRLNCDVGSIWFVGSCNGVVCIGINKKDFILWNPCAEKTKILPELVLDDVEIEIERIWPSMFGFGFDESSDDYKVVGILDDVVKVYSLKTDRWRRIADFRFGHLRSGGKFACGKLHWDVTPWFQSSEPCFIVSLDLESEAYAWVEFGEFGEFGEVWPDLRLSVLDGCVCVLCNWPKENMADMWLMKDYGIKESWTKLGSVPYVNVTPGYYRAYSQAFCILPSGEILLGYDGFVVLFDPKNERVNHFIELERQNRLCFYVESSISPDAMVDLAA